MVDSLCVWVWELNQYSDKAMGWLSRLQFMAEIGVFLSAQYQDFVSGSLNLLSNGHQWLATCPHMEPKELYLHP
jgi:hypothetical protein